MNRPPTILCIDDEELGLLVRKAVLERAGYHVLTAAEGQQGLELFDNNSIDGVVLDYSMPGMNGMEIARIMRNRKPHVPILLHSAYVGLPPEAIALASHTLTKDSTPADLLRSVEQLVGHGGKH